MKSNNLTILDRLNEILESVELIEGWSSFASQASDFMMSPHGVMAFNACVMRLQVIGENVGKLLRDENKPLEGYDSINRTDNRDILHKQFAEILRKIIIDY